MDENEAIFQFGQDFMTALDKAFEAGLTLDEIKAEAIYQVDQARESGDYE